MILVSVGTFVRGFDELVAAADAACGELCLEGFAQIGHSSVAPRHMDWARFLPEAELRGLLRRARIVVCHGGMGILGEAMRAGRPILAVPRRGEPSARHPANDQAEFVARLAERCPIEVCPDPEELQGRLGRMVETAPESVAYPLESDVPRLIGRFLAEAA